MRKLTRALTRRSDFMEKIEDIKDFLWYDRVSTFRKYKEMIERMIYWSYNMRWSWDFDAHTIYEVMYMKLDRIHNVMKNNSHCMWNATDSTNRMRKLCEAKYLAKKLNEYDYDTQAFIETEEKYGHTTWFTPIEDSTSSLYNSKWNNDPKNAKLYYKTRGIHYRNMRRNERKRLFYLLEKYIGQWWD